jgi:hypothetical protein
MSEIKFVSGKYQAMVNGKIVKRTKLAHLEYVLRKAIEETNPVTTFATKPSKFTINQRFEFVRKLVNMVSKEIQVSAIITGKGGLGKSYIVNKTLLDAGFKDISDKEDFQSFNGQKVFRVMKGFSTARAFYKTLYANNNAILICDDMDSIQRDKDAVGIMKAALDSNNRRIVTWGADNKNEDIPNSFIYTGRIIFISNMAPDSIDQAIRSRSMMIDLSMTKDEMIDRMEFISKEKDFMPDFDTKHKDDAIGFMRKIKDSANDLSLRSLISIVKVRAANKDWEDMAEYIMN